MDESFEIGLLVPLPEDENGHVCGVVFIFYFNPAENQGYWNIDNFFEELKVNFQIS